MRLRFSSVTKDRAAGPPMKRTESAFAPAPAESHLDAATDRATSYRDAADSFNLSGALNTVINASSGQDAFGPLRAVVASLDSLSKIHPFIAIAAIPFQVVVTLEMNRRENDRRILVLITQMTGMMAGLQLLPHERLRDGAQEATLESFMSDVKDLIEECGNAIEVYYKSKLLQRIVKAPSWHEKLEAFSQTIADLKERLHTTLLIIIHSTTSKTATDTLTYDSKINEVLRLLKRRTEFELEVEALISRYHGIQSAITNNEFMWHLVQKFEGLGEPLPRPPLMRQNSATPPSHKRSSRDADSYFPNDPQRKETHSISIEPAPFVPPRASSPGLVDHVLMSPPATEAIDVPSNPQQSLPLRTTDHASTAPSVQQPHSPLLVPLPAMPPPSRRLSSMLLPSSHAPHDSGTIAGASISPGSASRKLSVFDVNTSDPTSPLNLKLIEQYRQELRFALSTELEVLLQQNTATWSFKLDKVSGNLTRHIDLGTQKVLAAIDGVIRDGPHEKIKDEDLRELWKNEKWRGSVKWQPFLQAVQDFMLDEKHMARAASRSEEWAVHFLSVPYRHPLLQEIDRDCSAFISIAEVNQFTDSKPEELSLLLWLAYSATVWAFEANECQKHIKDSWLRLAELVDQVDEKPYAIFDLEISVLTDVKRLLEALRIPSRKISEPLKHPRLVHILDGRLTDKFDQLEENLERVHWDIDSSTTLHAVAGDLPIETYLLPLLSILIARFVEQVEDGVPPLEIASAIDTFKAVLDAVDERVAHLMDCYRASSTRELTLSFSLFSRWNLRDIPTEAVLPKFASVGSDDDTPSQMTRSFRRRPTRLASRGGSASSPPPWITATGATRFFDANPASVYQDIPDRLFSQSPGGSPERPLVSSPPNMSSASSVLSDDQDADDIPAIHKHGSSIPVIVVESPSDDERSDDGEPAPGGKGRFSLPTIIVTSADV